MTESDDPEVSAALTYYGAVLVEDKDGSEVYDVTVNGEVVTRCELLKPPDPSWTLYVEPLAGDHFAFGWRSPRLAG